MHLGRCIRPIRAGRFPHGSPTFGLPTCSCPRDTRPESGRATALRPMSCVTRPIIFRCSRSSTSRRERAACGVTLLAMNGVLDELVDDIAYWERLYERLPASVT